MVYDFQYYYIWVIKYRYKILTAGEVAHRILELMRQCCKVRNIPKLSGHVSTDHIQLEQQDKPQQLDKFNDDDESPVSAGITDFQSE